MTFTVRRPRVMFDTAVSAWFRATARLFGLAAALLGAAVAVGWWLAVTALRDPIVGSMKVNSAIAFALAGVGVLLAADRSRSWPRAVPLLGGAVALLGLATLVEHVLAIDLLIDERLAPDLVESSAARGRMAPLVAFGLVLVGVGLALSVVRRLVRWSSGLGLTGTALALLPAAGYIFDAPTLYSVGSDAIAAHTAVALILVSLGLVLSVPEQGPLTTLSAAGTAGTMARYLVPGAVLVPLAVGAAIHHGALLSARVELSVFALTSSAILTAITWWAMNLGVVAEHERKANQEQLQRSERRLATTLSSLGDAVITTDAAAVITGLNPAAESLLGTTEVEARGRQFAEIVRLVDAPTAGTDLATLALRAGARVAAADHRPLVGADGVRPITYTAAPIVGDDAAVEGAVVVLHDAAERVRVQEALSSSNRLASLGTLSAGIAHEINNPLTVVDLNLEMLRRQLDAGGSRPRELLDHIDEGLKRVTAIVRDMRIFARGDALVPRQPVDLHAVIESALRIVAPHLRQRARLNVELCPVPPVLASESQLGQVLVNLLSNAIDAIPEDAVGDHVIAVGTARADDARVAIWVRDTGVGMSPALRAQLFTPFHTTKPVGAGTGLGLAISRGLVESMGGTIEVESEEGRGSTFRVLLPVATGTASVPAIVPERSAPPVAAPRLRVLVVDDEWALARALAVSLGRSHDAVAVQSGAEALVRLGNDPAFDAVVCDVAMPGMSGLELYRHASAAWPHLAARFVFMTGGAPAPDVAAFLGGVTAGYLIKPFAVEALEERLQAVTAIVVSTDR